MKLNKNLIYFVIFFTFFGWQISIAQDQRLTVEFGETSITLNKPFTVSILLKNEEERPNCKFPEIPGFKKRGIVSTSGTSQLNGKTVTDHKVSQEYFAQKAGVFNVPSFNIQANELNVSTNATVITVLPATDTPPEQNFKDFIDGSAYEFIDVKDDAFFAVTSNKLRPYVGEGMLITVAFYVASNNKAELVFFNESAQLDAILKSIKPKNCWEENLGISEIKVSKLINIGKKKYNQYKIFQAIYYPLNNQPIVIPAVNWQMVKYKIAKDREVSSKKIESRKNYQSKAMVIRPLNLPKNTFNNTDFVGDFELVESVNKALVQTGRSFKYNFIVKGIGNFDVLRFPEMISDSLFEIYEPKSSIGFSENFGKQIKEKSFSFDIVPKFAGKFNLKDHFFIKYFNTRTKTYQELRAKTEIEVVGHAINDNPEPILLENDLYDGIEKLKSDETGFDFRSFIFNTSNIIVILMLFAMIFIIWPFNKTN
jgi:BatD DUF11 like domain